MTGTADGVIRVDRIDFGAMVDALEAVADQFVALLGEIAEPEGERPVPGLRWTIGETAAHVLTILRRGTGDNRRADSLADLAELNEQGLHEVATRSPARLANLVGAEAQTLVNILRGLDDGQASAFEVQLHAGVRTDLPSALSYILCDLLAHGYDIATAADVRWDIDAAHAALDLHAIIPLMGPWLLGSIRSGPLQGLAISFSGDTDALVIEAGNGRYTAVNVDRSNADEVKQVDPVDTFLALSGRRESQGAAVARLASWFQPL